MTVGSHRVSVTETTEQTLGVTSLHPHPNFSPRNLANDLALLYLDTDIVYNDAVAPACLPTNPPHSYAERQAVISGWGRTNSGRYRLDILEIILTKCAFISITAPLLKFL